MHFRICCCCNGEEKGETAKNETTKGNNVIVPVPVDSVVTEQPKPTESIQLDRITEASVEESSVQAINDEEEPVATLRTPAINDDEEPAATLKTFNEMLNQFESTASIKQSSMPHTQFNVQRRPSVNPKPILSFNQNVGGDVMQFDQFQPGRFEGTYKGYRFTITNGQFHSIDGNYNDKELILEVFSQGMLRVQQGIKKMEAGILATMPSIYGQKLASLPVAPINVNYVTESGEKSTMSFNVIEQGLLKTHYKGKEFNILNGKIVTTDGADDNDLDKQVILMNYNKAILGMQSGILGMQRGMLGFQQGMQAMETGFMGYNTTNTTEPMYNVLANGQDTLKRMRSLNLGKRVSVVEAGVIAQPRQPVLLIEDTTAKSKKARLFQEEIPEPVLTKTTFKPTAIIYDDPKLYDKLDSNELPNAKRLSEYIISLDETANTGNSYYFHAAKPRRVNRKKLSPMEQLHVASEERYSLFESQSVKIHNEYRKIHGVPPLVNNEFLCQVAREWAEHLALKDAFYHRPNNEYGENLYYADGMPVCAKKAIKAWYDEIDLYDYNNPKFSKETGHFTQLVWKDTREVGTGVAQIGDKIWVCCNYHPPGNYGNKFNEEFIPRPVLKRTQRF